MNSLNVSVTSMMSWNIDLLQNARLLQSMERVWTEPEIGTGFFGLVKARSNLGLKPDFVEYFGLQSQPVSE